MRSTFAWVAVLGCVAAMTACSSSGGNNYPTCSETGSGGGSGCDTVKGSVGGDGLVINGATALVGMTSALTGKNENVVLIGFTSASGANCSNLQNGVETANTTGLGVLVISGTPVAAASYPINPKGSNGMPVLPAASAFFNKTNAKCADLFDAGSAAATDGTVTISAITSTTISGTYDLTFSGGSLQGSFTAPVCAGIDLNSVFASTTDAGETCVSQ